MTDNQLEEPQIAVPNGDDYIDLAGTFRTLWQGRARIAFYTFIGAVLGFLLMFRVLTPSFDAEALMSIEIESSKIASALGISAVQEGVNERANAATDQILSQTSLDVLIKRLDLLSDPEFNRFLDGDTGLLAGLFPQQEPASEAEIRQETYRSISEKVSVTRKDDSFVFVISARTDDAHKSALIANTLAEIYLETAFEKKKVELRRTSEWLRDQISILNQTLVDLTQDGLGVTEQNDYDATLRKIASLENRLRAVELERDEQSPSGSIILRAAPDGGVALSQIIAVMAAMMVGMIVGIIVTLLRDSGRLVFNQPADVTRFAKLPVLAEIPAIPKRQRDAVLTYFRDKPRSRFVEAFRALRNNVKSLNGVEETRVIVIASSLPNEGNTLNAICLAESLSAAYGRTLFFEGDMRQGALKAFIGHLPTAGYLDVIKGDLALDAAILTEENLGMDVLPSGIGDASGDIFTSAAFEDLLKSLAQRYDNIVINTPPVLALSDAAALSKYADAVVLSVKAHATTEETVKAGLEAFSQAGVSVSGIVLGGIESDPVPFAPRRDVKRLMAYFEN